MSRAQRCFTLRLFPVKENDGWDFLCSVAALNRNALAMITCCLVRVTHTLIYIHHIRLLTYRRLILSWRVKL